MTSKLISICQLFTKDYTMKMRNKRMKVYDSEGRLILKAPQEDNKNFKMKTNMIVHHCLALIIKDDIR